MPKALALLLLFLPFSGAHAGAAVWDPARTWVFAVGVIEFADKEIDSWPQERRKDAVLIELLRAKGVPEGQIVFLKDQAASLEQIRSAFRELLARTSAGDTLFFYYTGHGSEPTETFPTQFLSYDYDGADTSWGTDEILREIEAGFRGESVFLTADTCFGGALCSQAAAQGGRIAYGCLTSASPSVYSTGNWTFTEALIEGFSGKPFADLDRDGAVSWAELSRLAELDMAVLESQPPASRALFGWEPSLSLVRGVLPPRHAHEGLRVEHLERNLRARVVEAGPLYLLDFTGDPMLDHDWAEPGRLRPVPLSSGFHAGEPVLVEWQGGAKAATVLLAGNGVYKVRLSSDALEEWVTEAQVYRPGEKVRGFTSFDSFQPRVERHKSRHLRLKP